MSANIYKAGVMIVHPLNIQNRIWLPSHEKNEALMAEKMTANVKGFGKTQQNLFDWISVGSLYMIATQV